MSPGLQPPHPTQLGGSVPNHSTAQTSFIEVSNDFGLYLSSNEELPPTLCPDLIPVGWELTDEVLDFQIGDEYVEAYILQRAAT